MGRSQRPWTLPPTSTIEHLVHAGPSNRRDLAGRRRGVGGLCLADGHGRMAGPRERRGMEILVVDIGGSRVKIRCSGEKDSRSLLSGPAMTPDGMTEGVLELAADWPFDVVSLGYPGEARYGRPSKEPNHLARGWVDFDYRTAFGRPVKIVNDAAMASPARHWLPAAAHLREPQPDPQRRSRARVLGLRFPHRPDRGDERNAVLRRAREHEARLGRRLLPLPAHRPGYPRVGMWRRHA